MKGQAGGGRASLGSGAATGQEEAWLARSVSVAWGPHSVWGSYVDTLGLPISEEAFENRVSRMLGETERTLVRIVPSYSFVTEACGAGRHQFSALIVSQTQAFVQVVPPRPLLCPGSMSTDSVFFCKFWKFFKIIKSSLFCFCYIDLIEILEKLAFFLKNRKFVGICVFQCFSHLCNKCKFIWWWFLKSAKMKTFLQWVLWLHAIFIVFFILLCMFQIYNKHQESF